MVNICERLLILSKFQSLRVCDNESIMVDITLWCCKALRSLTYLLQVLNNKLYYINEIKVFSRL